MRLLILKVISFFSCISKSTNEEQFVNDNDDSSRQEQTKIAELHFSKLNQIIDSNEKSMQKIQQFNERFENILQVLITEVESIKNTLVIQRGSDNNGEYNLQAQKEIKKYKPPTEKPNTNGSWTIIQRRQDGSVDFNRIWFDYKKGFGNPNGEFFIGLDKIHELTNKTPHELLIVLKDIFGNKKYAYYNYFLIGSEVEKYQLKSLGNYRGNAGDNLRNHLNKYFSTKDRNNGACAGGSCGQRYQGAWWFSHCMTSNLNGPFLYGIKRGEGITWGDCNETQFSYQFSQIMIRAKTVKLSHMS